MKAFVACVVLCALAAVQGRQLQQKTFPTVAAALEANKADLSTLAAAIKVCVAIYQQCGPFSDGAIRTAAELLLIALRTKHYVCSQTLLLHTIPPVQ